MPFGIFDVAITGDSSKLRSEFTKSVSAAQSASKSIRGAFNGVQGALAGIGVSLSVAGFGAFIKSNIDALDRLGDLAQIAGISATKLGGIGFAAKQSGVDIEALSKGIKFLNVELAKATAGDAAAQELFSKLGIDPSKVKGADQALLTIADRFRTYTDGAGKAQIATVAFGKAGEQLIPFLNQGGEEIRKNIAYFEKYSGISDELVEKADKFNDELDKLSLLSGAFGKALTAELLPSLDALVREFVRSKEEGQGFAGTASTIVDGIRVIARAAVIGGSAVHDFGNELGFLAAEAGALLSGDLGRMKAIFDDRIRFVEEGEAKVKRILDAINGKSDAQAGPPRPKTRPAPTLSGGKASADADAAAKALVAQQLKSLEEGIKAEEDLLKRRESFLDLYYAQGLINTKEFYDTRRTLINDALQAEVAAYDKEIAVLEKEKLRAAPGKDRIEVETKIAEVVAKRTKAQTDAADQGNRSYIEETQAAQKFLDKVKELQAVMLDIRGDTAGGAALRFDVSTKQFRDEIEAQKKSQDETARNAAVLAEQYLVAQRKNVIEQAALNDKSSDFNLILDQLSTAQGRLALERNSGGSTELVYLTKLGEANKGRVAELKSVADAYLAIAVAAGDKRAIAAAEAMKLKIEELAETANAAAQKINTELKDSFSDAFTDFIIGTKSAKEAFNDFVRSVTRSAAKLASEDIAQSVFGKGGIGANAGGLLASIFGGSTGGFTAWLNSLIGGASGGINLGLFGGSGIGALAGGTDFWRGGATWVGEQGPELVNLPRGSQVTPNHELRHAPAGDTYYTTINPPPGASRQTTRQALNQATQRQLQARRT